MLLPAGRQVSGAAYRQRMALAAAAQIHTWLTAAQDGQAMLDGKALRPMISRCWCSGREAAVMQQALYECSQCLSSNRESVFAQPVAHDGASAEALPQPGRIGEC